jgi:hypothetical protein
MVGNPVTRVPARASDDPSGIPRRQIMRNLLALAGLAVVTVVGVGWYLGWYKVQDSPTPDGHHHIQIDVDANKVKSDVNKGESKIHDFLSEPSDSNPER